MKEKTEMQYAGSAARRTVEEGLGPNSDIGMKLRALYGAVQDESIPDKFLELLEKLDQVERQTTLDAANE